MRDRRRGVRWVRVVCLAVLLSLCTTDAFGGDAVLPAPSRFADELSAQTDVADEQARRLHDRRADLRATPQARGERLRSRTEFGGLRGREALAVAEQHFPRALADDVWRGAGLRRGERVERWIGDFGARIARDGEPVGLVQSTVPLRVAEQGARAPVELALTDDGGALRSKRPIVPVRYGTDPADGITLERIGMSVRPAGISADARAQIEAGRYVATSVERDTDVWATPHPGGFELVPLLRSAASPERLDFVVGLPRGAELLPGPDGSAEVVRDRRRLVTISAPVAWDADQQPVPVTLTVAGNALILRIAHRDRDIRYPVLVDPVFEEWNWIDGFDLEQGGWQGDTGSPGLFDSAYLDLPHRWGRGLYIFTREQTTVPSGAYSQLVFNPPGRDSYVFRAEFMASANGLDSCMYRGIWGGHWEAVSNECYAPVTNSYVVHCAVSSCSPDAGVAGNVAVYGLQSTSTAWRTASNKAISSLGLAVLSVSDRDLPDFNLVNRQEPPWRHDWTAYVTGPVRDFGVGVTAVAAEIQGTDWGEAHDLDCYGVSWSPCPESTPTDFMASNADSRLAGREGRYPLVVHAWDALGKQSSALWGHARIDRSAPEIGLAGALWDQRVQGTTVPTLAAGSHLLRISATDGVPNGAPDQRRSGVRGIEVAVDGIVQLPADNVSCPSDSCGRTRDWTFSTASFSGGRHLVTVTVTDQVGHSARTSFEVVLPTAGELLSPRPNTSTSRWLQLEARAVAAGLTSARFQYRRPLGTWQDVPLNALVDANGSPIATLARPFAGQTTAPIYWNVPLTLQPLPGVTANGPLELRAVFAGGLGGIAKAAKVTFDDRGLGSDNAREDVGPGEVDLVTGNLAVAAVDATIESFAQDLSVSRTFNSRDPSGGADGPFGPGWVVGATVEGAAEYTAVQEVTHPQWGPHVEVSTVDGSTLFFDPLPNGSYQSETGYESFVLTKPAADRFELRDDDGIVTVFLREPGTTAARYVLREIRQPGSENKSSVTYEVVGGRPRLRRVLAPVPAGVTCDVLTTPGCRSLELVYATDTTATSTAEAGWGRRAGLVDRVQFTAFDPETGAARTDVVGQYLYDSGGRLRAVWDPRISPALTFRYSYDAGGRLSEIAPPGEAPWTLSYAQRVGDADGGRLKQISRSTPQGTATTTLVYAVPISGPAAPHQLGPEDVARWGQVDRPLEATAVFLPDAVPTSDPPADYARAAVHYVNRLGREVNTVAPGGHTTTTEYDRYGNVVRELTAGNRERALGAGSGSAALAGRLDTQRTYEDDGTELVLELGPEHEVELADGSTARARRHTRIAYDEGASGVAPHLPTTSTVSAQLASGATVDARVTRTEYDWTLRKPTKRIVDVGGLALVERTTYDPGTGLPLSTFKPRFATSGPASITTAYYRAGASDSVCGWRPQFANLPCRTNSFAVPVGSSELPELPTTTYAYNRLNQQVRQTEEVDDRERHTTMTYDAAGRLLSSRVSSSTDGDGLAAAYGFEEPSGATVSDRSGNGNDGTIQGAIRNVQGRFGRALEFRGGTDVVTVAGSRSIDFASSFTLEAWVRPDRTSGGWQTVLTKTGASSCSPAYALHTTLGATPRLGPHAQWCGWWRDSSDGQALPGGVWSHLAATKDGSAIKLYVNGTQISSGTIAGVAVTNSGQLRIGPGFDGVIDEVRLYDRALTPGELRSDMAAAVQPDAPPPTSPLRRDLVAAYGFEERQSSAVVVDSSGNGIDGRLASSTRTMQGRHGRAITGVAQVPDTAALDLTTGMTLMAWVRPQGQLPGGMTPLVSKQGSYALRIGPMGMLEFAIDPAGRGAYLPTHAVMAPQFGLLAPNRATHVAGTYDGQTLSIYVDGVLRATRAIAASAFVGTAPLTIGNQLTGTTDSVRLYSRALTATEIAEDAVTPIVTGRSGGDTGAKLPTVTAGYHPSTGRPITLVAREDGVTRSTVVAYDSVGRVTSYRDADGNTATTTYDLLDRVTATHDGKGGQTLAYEPITGLLTELQDEHAGRFEAAYDADGQLVTQKLPNGLTVRTVYDETGSAVRQTHLREDGCTADCTWLDEQVGESIHGQWLSHDGTLFERDYAYDPAGRLVGVRDRPQGQGCTVRSYAYDANSNRTSRVTRAPGAGGACATSGPGEEQSSTYDGADRITNAGFEYDLFGRITNVPASHSGGGPLATSYYVNDMVRSQSQDGHTRTMLLDPTRQRHRVIDSGDGRAEVLHYASSGDSPVWIAQRENGAEVGWQRNVPGIGGNLVAVHRSDGATTLRLVNLHGDVVATASPDPAATRPSETFVADEFGVPSGRASERFGWLGGKQRRTTLPSGVVQMGVRSYVPAMGRFTSVDPIVGASANAYDYAFQDPVNVFDLDGRCPICGIAIVVGTRVAAQQAARIVGSGAAAKVVAVQTGRKAAPRATVRAVQQRNNAFRNKYKFSLKSVDPHLLKQMKGGRHPNDGGVAPWAINHALHHGSGKCLVDGTYQFSSRYARVLVNPRTGTIFTANSNTSRANWGTAPPW